MAGKISHWLRPAHLPGDWHLITANSSGLFVTCALIRAHINGLQVPLEVSLNQDYDDLQNYLMVPELCHLPPHPVH